MVSLSMGITFEILPITFKVLDNVAHISVGLDLTLIACCHCLPLAGQGEGGPAGLRGEPGLKGDMVSL